MRAKGIRLSSLSLSGAVFFFTRTARRLEAQNVSLLLNTKYRYTARSQAKSKGKPSSSSLSNRQQRRSGRPSRHHSRNTKRTVPPSIVSLPRNRSDSNSLDGRLLRRGTTADADGGDDVLGGFDCAVGEQGGQLTLLNGLGTRRTRWRRPRG